MSNNEKNKTDDLNWSDFQEKYFDALKSFNSADTLFNNNSSANSFWSSAIDQWWTSVKTGENTHNENLFEKIVGQSQNYYFLGEQFSNLINGISSLNNKKDVNSFINKTFEDLQSMFSQKSSGLSWGSLSGAFDMPFAGMKNNTSDGMFDFSNMFDFNNADMKAMRNKLLSMPGIGHSRESQEKIQKLIKLGAIYQDNAIENQEVMTQLSQDALELMRKKILHMNKKGENFESMRQIYDLWVESNEKVYADHAFTNEYSELNGRLVNSQMAFMKLSQEVNEDILTAMNIPTNSTVNELERRHYELRKKVKELESELKAIKEGISKQKPTKSDSVVKTKSVSTTKKKTAKKKVSKKKIVNKAAKATKKKVQKKRSPAKKDVIEIKF